MSITKKRASKGSINNRPNPLVSQSFFSSSFRLSKGQTRESFYSYTHPTNPVPSTNKGSPHRYRYSTSINMTSNTRNSFSSNEERSRRTHSPVQMSRSGSSGSTNSYRSTDDRRRYDNTVYHYGRHSNYWLFGGFSVRDTVRDGVDWVRQQKKG